MNDEIMIAWLYWKYCTAIDPEQFGRWHHSPAEFIHSDAIHTEFRNLLYRVDKQKNE